MILQKGELSLASAVAIVLSIAIAVARHVTVKNGWLKRYKNIQRRFVPSRG
jgi:hypothetical protein